jgi:hypothetical protein
MNIELKMEHDECEKDLKTIAFLELSGLGAVDYDRRLKKTFDYYACASTIFKKIPVIDTQSDIQYTIELLEYYYKNGFRIFIGFTRSTVLYDMLTWFQQHPEAIGISAGSTGLSLNIPKNIYRVTPSDMKVVDYIFKIQNLSSIGTLYYVYSEGEIACLNLLNYFLENVEIQVKLKSFGIDPYSSNVSVESISEFFQGSNVETDLCILYSFVGDQRIRYLETFNEIGDKPVFHVDMSLQSLPEWEVGENDIWNFQYSSILNKNIGTSELWRLGYEALKNEYCDTCLNVLQLNQYLSKKINIMQLSNFAYIQEFELDTKDTVYFSLGYYRYYELKWEKVSIYVWDPIYGMIYYLTD